MKGGNWVVGVVDGVRVSSAGMEKRRRGAVGVGMAKVPSSLGACG